MITSLLSINIISRGVSGTSTLKDLEVSILSKEKAKWDAWNSIKGMTSEEARAEYVKLC